MAGTRWRKNLDENLGALDVGPTRENLATIEAVFPLGADGTRTPSG